jgi:hypothetical protein
MVFCIHVRFTNNTHDDSGGKVNIFGGDSIVLWRRKVSINVFNPLAPSDPYMGRTTPLTSRHCILNTYSTNTCTEYFKRAA